MKKIINIILLIFLTSSTLSAEEAKLLKIGSVDAKITIKVFSSLTCPHCANFHNKIYDDLKKEYIDKKKVKFEHHGFPLDLAALNAEKMLRCSQNNEKKFLLLSEIYEKQDQWAVGSDINIINESIKKMGLKFGLNNTEIDTCFKDEELQDQILNERIDAQKNYKISKTPTIYLNEKKYEGKHDFSSLKKSLDKLL